MRVTLMGLGGGAGTVTQEARDALEQADAVIGSPRLLDTLDDLLPADIPLYRDCPSAPRIPEVRPAAIADLLTAGPWTRPCVVYSGDTGFHSGAAGLIPLLEAREIPFRVFPGLSSVQLLSARLGRPWQGWRLATAHGMDCDPVPEVCRGAPVFFLIGPGGVSALCGRLAEAGLGNLPVTVGENLSLPGERVIRTTAAEAARDAFAPLSVLLAEAAPGPDAFPIPGLSDTPPTPRTPGIPDGALPRTPGIPDNLFLRGDVPMTKQLVRAAALSLLGVRPDDTLWDIGAGTGSVSVELALAARRGRVYAVERRESARELILANRARFCAWNLSLAGRNAPEDLASLPVPDAVFLGGAGGRLAEILDAVLDKNPAVRLCVSAVTVETLSAAMAYLTDRGLDPEVVHLSVSRTGSAPGSHPRPGDGERSLHLLRAENPVFLISANGRL
ncbi:MAG: precorrin-6Y C5,15-methyltransferase (decarboxylating) subunit CbiT [Oscillibacter sp.]|nr:precorrin-6Y C5,15-methyltransferase (decarboxylating) subunit CbiT [Oscillibacter sp.]